MIFEKNNKTLVMAEITYIERSTQTQEKEKIYGARFLELLYGGGFFSSALFKVMAFLACKSPILSIVYGWLQKTPISKYKIEPFLKEFDVDASEFVLSASQFCSFNDFFIRKLKPSARPIVQGDDIAIMPADARYLVFEDVSSCDGFVVKGVSFSLKDFFQDDSLAKRYSKGSMVIARLCPSDYHRFHFPFSCVPSKATVVHGSLFSVNPLALKKNIDIFTQNRRHITVLESRVFGSVAFVEVGATCVGQIHYSYKPYQPVDKGEEKGYFSFGGSSIVMFFEPGAITFDQDLIDASKKKMEIRALMGQSLGHAVRKNGQKK